MENKYNLVFGEFYSNYIQLVNNDTVIKAVKKNSRSFLKFLKNIPASKLDFAYAEGKWTIKELLQHIIDSERVFAYRTLRIARFDETPLPGYDENKWANATDVSVRSWKSMIREFRLLRKSNLLMIEDFSNDQLAATGIANNHPVSVAALCYILAGHVKHHMNVIEERYGIESRE